MSLPTKRQLKKRIEALRDRAIASGSEPRPFPCPEKFQMRHIIELSEWTGGELVSFVFEAETGLMHRAVLAPGEEGDFGYEVRFDLSVMSPDRHRRVIMFVEPRKGPEDGQIHQGVVAQESFHRDKVELTEILIYAAGA